MRDKPRRVVIHKLAQDEVAQIKREYPAEHRDMIDALKVLALADDPRNPGDSSVDVCRSWPHATDCSRVRRKVSHWRLVIRYLRQDADGSVYKLAYEDEHTGAEIIQIVFADLRNKHTYKVLEARAAAL